MSGDVQDLQAPLLLLAMPQVTDPFFQRSVVLLVHHNEEGSFGFIANRPTELEIAEILSGMEIHWRGAKDLRAFFGGPVQPQLGTVLFDTESAGFEDLEALEESSTEVLPGLRMSQHVGDLTHLAGHPSRRFRFFLGYAGWGEGQLVQEILRNDWLMAPPQEELLFSVDTEAIWSSALRSVGVDPDTLPSWTPEQGDGGAN